MLGIYIFIYTIYFISLTAIVISDIRKKEIPFLLSMLNLILAVVVKYHQGIPIKTMLIYALLPALFFVLINFIYYFAKMDFSRDVIGYGDIYLLPSITLMFMEDLLYVLFFTFLSLVTYDTLKGLDILHKNNTNSEKQTEDQDHESIIKETPLAPFLLIGIIFGVLVSRYLSLEFLIKGGLIIV